MNEIRTWIFGGMVMTEEDWSNVWEDPMYQHNDLLTQLFTKYKYIWLWLQCFDPYLGHRQAYIINLESEVHV
jgi:hypothetical protein